MAAANPPMATGSWLEPAAPVAATGAAVVVADPAPASLLEDPDPSLVDEDGASVVEEPSDGDSVADEDPVPVVGAAVSPEVGLGDTPVLREDTRELT